MNHWVGFVAENLQGTMYFGQLLLFCVPNVDLVPVSFYSHFLSQDMSVNDVIPRSDYTF